MDLLELQLRIKEGVAKAFPGKYWVKAEISSWSPRSNGHCYLSLSQSRGGKPIAESRAMIWNWHFPRVKQTFEQATGQALQAGITVLVRVQVNFSELYGISLFIDDIDPAFTLGEKALERRRAIERLTAAGYMELQKELALPDVPYRLAVITSKTAAGYGDFRKHLLENAGPAIVQWIIDGAKAVIAANYVPAVPDCVRTAIDNYRGENDWLSHFLDDHGRILFLRLCHNIKSGPVIITFFSPVASVIPVGNAKLDVSIVAFTLLSVPVDNTQLSAEAILYAVPVHAARLILFNVTLSTT